MKIKNWNKWQTYRSDRGAPPWIKVHRNLLSNPDWAVLSDSEKGQLISLWIIAADKSGEIPDNPVILQKICQLDAPPNISKFIELGFMTSDGCQVGVKLASSGCQVDAPEKSRVEENREEKSRVDTCTASSAEPSILTYSTTGKVKEWNLTQSQVKTWQDIYPTIDVIGNCKSAWGWLDANPSKRKTATGMKRFLTSWFERNINSGRTSVGNKLVPQDKDYSGMVDRALSKMKDAGVVIDA